MSTQTTTPHESGESSSEESSVLIRAKETIKSYAQNGSIAFLIGGTMLVWAIRNSRRSPERAALQALGAAALFGIGLRQRQSTGSDSRGDGERERGGDSDEKAVTADTGDSDVSAEAAAAIEHPGSGQQTEEDSRDVSDDTETGAESEDEGETRFGRDGIDEPRPKPGLDEDGATDPRRNDDLAEGDAEAEVDVSEAAIAAEPAEAAGPSSEQAQPTATKDRPTAMGAEFKRQFDQDDSSDANVGADEGEDEASRGRATGNMDEETSENGAEERAEGEDRDEIETEGGASIHTETIEAGTMDIDEGEATDPTDSESDSKDDETDEDREADDKTG